VTILRDASPGDVDDVVAVHRAAFASFFLTSLGPRFLAHLYAGYLAHPSGILVVADDAAGGTPIRGFVAGTTEPEAFYAWLRRRRGPAMALAAGPALARRPLGVGRRLVSAIRYRGEAPQRVPDAALLASLAVHPDSSGRGLGGVLVGAFVGRALEAGRSVTYLSTDVDGNDRVLEFYRRQGFHEAERMRRSEGREMAILIRSADASSPAPGSRADER
jgi:ribosomal protein S18 acetylase RimI-like enzyme